MESDTSFFETEHIEQPKYEFSKHQLFFHKDHITEILSHIFDKTQFTKFINALENKKRFSFESASAFKDIIQEITKNITQYLDYIESEETQNELRDIVEVFSNPQKLVLIGDRESYNLESIIRYCNREIGKFELGGMIVPGFELEDKIIDIFLQMRNTICTKVFHTPNSDKYFEGTFYDSQFLHVPYSAKELKKEKHIAQTHRKKVSRKLLEKVKMLGADIVFLSNFKFVLDSEFIENFEGTIVNVHPSYLPLLKGYRSEHRAGNLNETPQANGYTFHMVSKELDCGATIFQQKLKISNSVKEISQNGTKEEIMRLLIMRAQAKYTPHVLAIVSSTTPRKILVDEEAFTAEGRSAFFHSAEYNTQLKKEHKSWQENNYKLPYKQWHKRYRTPYKRVVFLHNATYKTLEEILQVDLYAENEHLQTQKAYTFQLRGSKQNIQTTWNQISNEITNHGKNPKNVVFQRKVYDHTNNVWQCCIETTRHIDSFLEKQNIVFHAENRLVKTTAKRKKIKSS